MNPTPSFTATPEQTDLLNRQGPFRMLEHQGRRGLQADSVTSRLQLSVDLNQRESGTLTLWILPMEELSHRYPCADPAGAHPGANHRAYPFLSDHPDPEDVASAAFALVWDCDWHPCFYMKWFKGFFYPNGVTPFTKLLVSASHMSFERLRWVQVAVSWDRPKSYAAIHVNGICISESPQHDGPLPAEPCGSDLYTGSPAYAVGDISVYDHVMSTQELAALYENQETEPDPDYLQHLRDIYYGEHETPFSFQPQSPWTQSLSLPLNRASDLEAFYVQGMTDAHRITPDGLEVKTGLTQPAPEEDRVQMYLWSEQMFTGPLYLSYEFMSLKNDGLSLLLTQASGLKGEDFMKEYPRRTTGSMQMVCWENIRNYHWEYYREMSDTPYGSATSGLIKNPWTTPLAYRRVHQPLEKNVWHRLEFLQEGERIRGAIDGIQQFDVTDSGTRGNGPVHRHGHFAIRCMLRTHMKFRNLEVWNQPLEYQVSS